MRIGLVSDTHIPEAGPELWPEAYEAFEGCEAILHAGDIYDISVVDRLNQIAPTWAARGNGDDGSSDGWFNPTIRCSRPLGFMSSGDCPLG